MKRLVLAWTLVFSISLMSYAQEFTDDEYDPKAVSNKNWNITIGKGGTADRMVLGDPENGGFELGSGKIDTIAGQIYVNRFLGVSLGLSNAYADYFITDGADQFAGNVDITTLSSGLLLRAPFTDFLDMYIGVGFGYAMGTLTNHSIDGGDLVRDKYTGSLLIPYAEGGLRIYVRHFTVGFSAKYQGFDRENFENMQMSDAGDLNIGGLIINAELGIAF